MKTRSLTRRLTMTVLLLELVSFGALVTAAVLFERHIHFRAFDVMLRGRADFARISSSVGSGSSRVPRRSACNPRILARLTEPMAPSRHRKPPTH